MQSRQSGLEGTSEIHLPGMCTLHANSAREALVKMCTLPLLARGEHLNVVGPKA